MRKSILAMIIISGLIGLVLTGCTGIGYIVGTGPMVNKTFDYTDFTGVDISSAFEYDISQSNMYSVVTSTNESIVDHLDIYKSGKTLIVRLKNGSFTNSNPKVTIVMPNLQKLAISGASKGSVRGFVSADNFDMDVSGASQLNLDIESGAARMNISGASKVNGQVKAQDTRMTVSGASRCELNGSTGTTNIEVSGASTVNASDLKMQNADATVSGASRANISTGGTLSVELSGASTLNYSGNPTLSKVHVTGASTLNAK